MEEINAVIAAVQQLGDNATRAFIWWLAVKYAVYPVVMFAGGSFLVWFLGRAIQRLVLIVTGLTRLASAYGVYSWSVAVDYAIKAKLDRKGA